MRLLILAFAVALASCDKAAPSRTASAQDTLTASTSADDHIMSTSTTADTTSASKAASGDGGYKEVDTPKQFTEEQFSDFITRKSKAQIFASIGKPDQITDFGEESLWSYTMNPGAHNFIVTTETTQGYAGTVVFHYDNLIDQAYRPYFN